MDAISKAAGTLLATLVNPGTVLGAAFYLALLCAAAVVANRLLRGLVRVSLREDTHNRLDRTALGFLQQLGSIGIWVVALVVYAHLIPSLRSLGTALLTGVSLVSIVIGLAAQNTLGNLVAGFALLIYRPFIVGDTLQVTAPTGTETGTVESISLGYTILRTSDRRRVVLSNSTVANQTTINVSRADTATVTVVPVNIAKSADIDRAQHTLLELAQGHTDVREVLGCPVTEIAASRVDLSLQVRCADGVSADHVRSDLLKRVAQQFDQMGIALANTIPASES